MDADTDDSPQRSEQKSPSDLLDEISCSVPIQKDIEAKTSGDDSNHSKSSSDLSKYYEKKRMRQLEAIYGQEDDL